MFEGHEALFRGLFILDQWDWRQSFPVLRFSFAGGQAKNKTNLNQKVS
ncbi:MAG: AAA family ATPase [Gammaproteobacteria bacterium]